MSAYVNPLAPSKKAKVPVYQMTDAHLAARDEQVRRAAYADAIYVCNAFYTAAMLTELRDTLGFGQQRLKKIFDRVQGLFSEIMEGRVSYVDLAQMLMDECQIHLIIEKPDGTTRNAMEVYKAANKGWKMKILLKELDDGKTV